MQRRIGFKAFAIGVIAIVAVPIAVSSAQASAPTVGSGWTRVWVDDFTGSAGSGINTSNWRYQTGTSYPGGAANYGTGEIETTTSSTANVYLDGNGNLAIKPIRASNGTWTSGRIETQRSDFQPAAGEILRVEGRLQMPNVTGAAAQGYWPAFWMLGAPFRGNYWNWPSVGEIDIMENVNGANTVWSTVHCGTNPGGACNETTGLGGNRSCPNTTCQSGFHTYATEWDRSVSPNQIRFYVDNVLFHTVSQNQVDSTTWANATDHGFFIILNVAIGGGWPGSPTSSTASGVPMLVDYVTVDKKSGSTSNPTSNPTSTPGTGGTAYATIQAESYNGQSGTVVEATSDSGGGSNVAYITNGDWLQDNNIDFGSTPAKVFTGRVASGIANGASGLVEVRLDSLSNSPIGSFALANTGGWQTWRSVPTNIANVTGKHTVYLKFTSGQSADFVNINWFTFAK